MFSLFSVPPLTKVALSGPEKEPVWFSTWCAFQPTSPSSQPLYPERFWDRKSIAQLEIRRKRGRKKKKARVEPVRKWFLERGVQGVIREAEICSAHDPGSLAREGHLLVYTWRRGRISLRNQDRREVCAGSDSEWDPGWGARAH